MKNILIIEYPLSTPDEVMMLKHFIEIKINPNDWSVLLVRSNEWKFHFSTKAEEKTIEELKQYFTQTYEQ